MVDIVDMVDTSFWKMWMEESDGAVPYSIRDVDRKSRTERMRGRMEEREREKREEEVKTGGGFNWRIGRLERINDSGGYSWAVGAGG